MLGTPISLSDACAANMLATKWLLAPSNRIAHQWIESLVRSGQSVVNLRATTLIRIALDLVGSDLAEQGLTFANRDALIVAIDQSWSRLAHDGYLRRLEQTDELSSAVLESILSLRLAGIAAEDIYATHLENPAKSKDIAILLQAYCELLNTHALVDTSDVLHRAIARLIADPSAIGRDTLILVPVGFHAAGLEREFLNALPPAQYKDLRHPMEREDAFTSDIGLLAHIGVTGSTPKPKQDCSVRFFRAVGEINGLGVGPLGNQRSDSRGQ